MSSSPIDAARSQVSRYVLDASALIALFNLEPGATRVHEIASDSCVSAVNLAEVSTKAAEAGQDLAAFAEDMASLGVGVIPFDAGLALEAGRLRTATRELGLSLGDRACLATALLHSLTAVTADRAWAELAVPVRVEVIR